MQANGANKSPQSAVTSGSAEIEALLSILNVARWWYDPVHNTVTWQQSFISSYDGSHRNTTESISSVLERYSQEDRTQLLQHFEAALKEGMSGPKRFAVYTRNGDRTYIESAGIRVQGEDGYPIVAGVYRNRAADVGNEVALRDFSSLLLKMTSVSKNAMLLITNQGDIRSVNPEFCRLFKLPADHGLVGVNMRNAPGWLGKAFVGTLTPLLEAGTHDVQNRKQFLLPDGTELPLSYRILRFGANGRSGGVLFEAEEERVSHINLGTLFDNLPTPMVAINIESSKIVAANAMARRYLGVRKELLGREEITARMLRPDDLRTIMHTIGSVGIENGHPCLVKSLFGDMQKYRLRALPYMDGGRRLLVIEFHPGKKIKLSGGDNTSAHRNVFKRMVQHLDF